MCVQPDTVHAKLAKKRAVGIIQEEEWCGVVAHGGSTNSCCARVDIVKHLYEDDDALQVISKVWGNPGGEQVGMC